MVHGIVETTGGKHHEEGGPPMGWHQELLIGFDLETTGTDPREARIVTGAVIEVKDESRIGHREWLADPGVEIPADAVAVHGITQRTGGGRGQARRPGGRRDRGRPRLVLADGRAGRRLQRGLRPDPALRGAAAVRSAVAARPAGRRGSGARHRPVHDRPLGGPLPPRQAQPRSGLHGVRGRRSTPPTTPRPTRSPRPGWPVR